MKTKNDKINFFFFLYKIFAYFTLPDLLFFFFLKTFSRCQNTKKSRLKILFFEKKKREKNLNPRFWKFAWQIVSTNTSEFSFIKNNQGKWKNGKFRANFIKARVLSSSSVFNISGAAINLEPRKKYFILLFKFSKSRLGGTRTGNRRREGGGPRKSVGWI